MTESTVRSRTADRRRPTDADRDDETRLDEDTSRTVRRRSLRLLGNLLRPHSRTLAWAGVLVTASTAAQVAGPWLVSLAIDRAVPVLPERLAPLAIIGAAYLAAAVLAGITIGAYRMVAARIAQNVLLELRRRVFRQTQRLSLEFHESYTSGRIISRQTSDLESLRELLDGGLVGVISSLLVMLFTAISLTIVDPLSGLVLAVGLVPAWFLVRWFQKRSQVAYREQRTWSARLIVKFVETMTGIRAVMAFNRQATTEQDYDRIGGAYRDANLRIFGINGRFAPGLLLIGNMTVVIALGLGGWRVMTGTLGIGVLVAVLLYVKRFFGPIQQIGMFYNAFQSAAAALEKVSALLAEESTVVEPADPVDLPDRRDPRGELRLDQVRFGYGDGPVVLPGLDLTIPAGQTVALVGTTGAGKSTIAKLVTRFYDPTAGHLLLDGVDVRDIASPVLRRNVVMVTQEAYLFSGSVAENIALGRPDATPEEIEAAARAVGVHDFVMELPDGYDTEVNKRGGRVSAGQRQLLSFARAFLADPTVLVLDEATSSLDLPSERLVQRGLATLLADRTAIIIAHRLSTVRTADRILVLAHGTVMEDGSPDELITRGGRFADMHEAWEDSLV